MWGDRRQICCIFFRYLSQDAKVSVLLKSVHVYWSLHECPLQQHVYYWRNRVLQRKRDSTYIATFLRSVVCLSVVCHIRAPCLNRSTDLDVIWQVHFLGPRTHGVERRSLTTRGRGDLGSNPQQKTCDCFRLTKKRWFIIHHVAASISDFAFYRITSIFFP